MSDYKLVPVEPTPDVSESKATTPKESWWAGYRAGKGLPANTPRQDAIAAPDVSALVEALETALFGTPLDDVSNRDNDDIWCLCYPHLPERASDALRDHLVRIETALTAHLLKEPSHDNQ